MFNVILGGLCIGIGDIKIRITKVMFLTTHITSNAIGGDTNLSLMSSSVALMCATNNWKQSPIHDFSPRFPHLMTPPNLVQSNQEEPMAIQFEAIDQQLQDVDVDDFFVKCRCNQWVNIHPPPFYSDNPCFDKNPCWDTNGSCFHTSREYGNTNGTYIHNGSSKCGDSKSSTGSINYV